MSSLKTRIDSQAAQDFLVRRFSRRASELERIAGGELSEAFFFEAEGERYVLRVDSRSRSFAKDVHAHRHFSSPLVPIPEVVQRGRFDQRYSFAISRRAPGVTHDTLALADRLRTLPSVFATLDAIHRTDISSTTGYGYWNGNGKAYRRSLASHVHFVRSRHHLLAIPYVDQDFLRRLWDEISLLLRYIPAERHLVHGDYGHNNLVIDGERVTGVLDWGEGTYGDFMHDVAWLDIWDPEIDYGQAAKEHYRSIGLEVTSYDERLRLYELSIAAGALGFFAYHHPQSVYEGNQESFKAMLA